jgi:hypothetical protein
LQCRIAAAPAGACLSPFPVSAHVEITIMDFWVHIPTRSRLSSLWMQAGRVAANRKPAKLVARKCLQVRGYPPTKLRSYLKLCGLCGSKHLARIYPHGA